MTLRGLLLFVLGNSAANWGVIEVLSLLNDAPSTSVIDPEGLLTPETSLYINRSLTLRPTMPRTIILLVGQVTCEEIKGAQCLQELLDLMFKTYESKTEIVVFLFEMEKGNWRVQSSGNQISQRELLIAGRRVMPFLAAKELTLGFKRLADTLAKDSQISLGFLLNFFFGLGIATLCFKRLLNNQVVSLFLLNHFGVSRSKVDGNFDGDVMRLGTRFVTQLCKLIAYQTDKSKV